MNTTADLQSQINDINRKVDLILEYVQEQRLKREVVDDLISDVSIIGKDLFRTTVEELDKQGCDLDTEELKYLLFKVLKNIKNISGMFEIFEATIDLFRDAAPLAKEMSIDFIKKLHEFEHKGYFEYLTELYKMLGQMSEHYSVKDLKNLSQNMDSVFGIFKQLTNTEFLKAIEHTTTVITTLKMDDQVDKKSYFKLMREMNSPEVRKSFSYVLRVVKEINKPK